MFVCIFCKKSYFLLHRLGLIQYCFLKFYIKSGNVSQFPNNNKKTFKLKVFIYSFHDVLGAWSQQCQQQLPDIFIVQNLIHTHKYICGYFPGFWWDFVHLEISQCWHKSWLGFFGNICHLHFACNHCIHYAPDFVQVGDVGMFWRVHSRVLLCLTKTH